MKSKTLWKKAIVKALRDKGFTKKGAKKTAVLTIQKSIAKHERREAETKAYTLKEVVIDGHTRMVKVYPPSVGDRTT